MELFNDCEVRKMMSMLKAVYHRSSHSKWGCESLNASFGNYRVYYYLASGSLHAFVDGAPIELSRDDICTLLANEVLRRYDEGEGFINLHDLGWSTDMIIEHHNKALARLANIA